MLKNLSVILISALLLLWGVPAVAQTVTNDPGLTFKLGSVKLSAGVLTTAFATTDIVLGVGYMFRL